MKRIFNIFFSLVFVALPFYVIADEIATTTPDVLQIEDDDITDIQLSSHSMMHMDPTWRRKMHNVPPHFDGPDCLAAKAGEEVEFALMIIDPNKQHRDRPHITADLPDGATFTTRRHWHADRLVGTFDWTPPLSGLAVAHFKAEDRFSSSTLDVFIDVFDGSRCDKDGGGEPPHDNHLPIWVGPSMATTISGTAVEFTATASDPDNDPLTITSHLPSGATYATSTGLFHWVPTQVGTTTAEFFAFDGSGTSTKEVLITVSSSTPDGGGNNGGGGNGGGGGGNHSPLFVNFNPPTRATSTESYTYDVDATDADNDPLSFSLVTRPAGMTIATSTGVISWTPLDADATSSPHLVVVQVSDSQTATSTSYSIIVEKKHMATTTTPISTTPPPSSGGGGGGGGGGGPIGNGPIFPLTPPGGGGGFYPSSPPTSPSTQPKPTQVTNIPALSVVPLQHNTALGKNPGAGDKKSGEASSSTTTGVAQTVPTGGKTFAGLLTAGSFNFLDWLKNLGCTFPWLLWILTMLAFITYVYFNRKKDDSEARRPLPMLPRISAAGGPQDVLPVENLAPMEDGYGYWETYPGDQEKS